MSSGGSGGYNSVTSSEPWTTQAKYLTPLFKTAFYGASGKIINPDYVEGSTNASEKNKYIDPLTDNIYSQFFNSDADQPGKLNYFGTKNQPDEGLWNNTYLPITQYTDTTFGAPTIAEFTDEQKSAQAATEALANKRINNANSLLGSAESNLKDVITGADSIPLYNINTPIISNPGNVSGQSINYTPAMQAASINSNLSMQPASLNYNYWNDLGNLAGGEGGNTYLDDMITAATRGINRNFTNNVIPGINSAAEEAGARGSGAWEDLRTQANQDYLQSIGDVEANIRGNAFNNQLNAQIQALGLGEGLASKASDYTQEANRLNTETGLQKALANAGYTQEANRLNTQLGLEKATTEAGYGQEAGLANVTNALQRYLQQANLEGDINKQNALLKSDTAEKNIQNEMAAIAGAPELNMAGYGDIGALAASGAEQQQMNQDILNAYIQQFEQGQLEPWNREALFSQLIGGNFGGTVTQSAKPSGGK